MQHKVERGVKKVCQYPFQDNRPKILHNFTKWFFEDADVNLSKTELNHSG